MHQNIGEAVKWKAHMHTLHLRGFGFYLWPQKTSNSGIRDALVLKIENPGGEPHIIYS